MWLFKPSEKNLTKALIPHVATIFSNNMISTGLEKAMDKKMVSTGLENAMDKNNEKIRSLSEFF